MEGRKKNYKWKKKKKKAVNELPQTNNMFYCLWQPIVSHSYAYRHKHTHTQVSPFRTQSMVCMCVCACLFVLFAAPRRDIKTQKCLVVFHKRISIQGGRRHQNAVTTTSRISAACHALSCIRGIYFPTTTKRVKMNRR